jgi:PIN like domain
LVGAKPTEERLAAIRKEGEERYAKKIPPGYEDAKKGSNGSADKFGDLIIWKEMIDKAKADKRPIIFVTDDGKSDWWHIHHGKKIGPHPYLVEEFLAATSEQFHIYELPQFLRYSAETGFAILPEAVEKIAETMLADTQAIPHQAIASERAVAIKALRGELRGKEFELDGLIKSLIDFPTRIGEEAPRDDAKRALKLRIGELNEVVNTLRDRLNTLESEPGNGGQIAD